MGIYMVDQIQVDGSLNPLNNCKPNLVSLLELGFNIHA